MIVLLLGCAPDPADPAVAARHLPSLVPAVTALDAAGVTFLRDQSWCHAVTDPRGAWADASATTCVLGPTVGRPFDPQATAEFARLVAPLRTSGVPVQWVFLTHDPVTGALVEVEVAVDGGSFRRVSWWWSAGAPPASMGSEQVVVPVPGQAGWSVVIGDWM